MKYTVLALALLLLTASTVNAQSNMYSQWPNFPQSSSFFPIAIYNQAPLTSLGSGATYGTVAQAMKGANINIALTIDGGSGGNGWPNSFGSDCGAAGCGLMQALVNQGIYVIPDVVTSGNTSASSVASIQRVASNLNASQYLIGYSLGDEPDCASIGTTNFSATANRVAGYDSTRPLFWNFQGYPFYHGSCGASYLKMVSVGSFDEYPLTEAWIGFTNIPNVNPNPHDSMWIQGWDVATFMADGRPGQPIWAFVDTGTTAFDFPQQNGSVCSESTNLCTMTSEGVHYFRSPGELVNAEVWMGIINGAMGIEYFPQDQNMSGQLSYDYALGPTVDAGGMAFTAARQAISAAILANLTYINTTVLSFAPQLNSPVLGRCTMQNGNLYSNYVTSCSNGILTMSTGTSTVPGSAIVKNYNGTLYLFADSDRNGQATMTFTLNGYAGKTATVVYDSNAKYDPAHSSVGQSFTLDSSGRFSDTFGSNGRNYQPKIYSISGSGGGPVIPTNLTATVQ